jgi:Flp pilus assembly protein TadG
MTNRPSIAARFRRSRSRAFVRDERGTAVVEFALVLIPLSLIIFGILDFGRALNYYNDLTQLAGQGARAASVNQNPDGTPADATFATQLACQADSPELRSRIRVQVTTAPASTDTQPAGKPVTVTTSFVFNFIPLVHAVSINLSSAQTERYESGNAPPAGITGLGVCP